MQSFGISRQQASKDINTYISEHAPKNLEYDKYLKGYVPSKQFKQLFIDNSASAYLHLLNQSHDRAPHIEGLALAYAHTEVLIARCVQKCYALSCARIARGFASSVNTYL